MPPFWATREFRWLAGILVILISILCILFFELAPLQQDLQKVRAARLARPAAELAPGNSPRRASGMLPQDPALDQALASAKDPTPVEEDDRAYRALLAYLSKVSSLVLDDEAALVEHRDFGKRSAELRGKPFQVTAMLLDWKKEALLPAEGTLDFVYRAYLLDPSGSEAYVVDLLEEPLRSLGQRDLVRTSALYLRIGSYVASDHEGRDRTALAPQLLGRRLDRVERATEKTTAAFDFTWIGVTLACLSVALLFLTIWIQRRSARGMHTHLRPSFAHRAPGEPKEAPQQPWEGFAERQWKGAAAAPAWGTDWSPPARKPAGLSTSGQRLPWLSSVLRNTSLWLVVSGVACVALAGWTGYRFWRDSQPRAPVIIDFSAESAAAVEAAGKAREAVRAVQEGPLASAGGPALGAKDIQALRDALRSLERSAVRLHDLVDLVRRAGESSGEPVYRQRLLDLSRLKLWVLDASDTLERARDREAPEGFFVPLRRIADARAKLEEEVRAATQAPSTDTSQLKERIDTLFREISELEEYLKAGLARETLEPAEIPEIQALFAERSSLERQRETISNNRPQAANDLDPLREPK